MYLDWNIPNTLNLPESRLQGKEEWSRSFLGGKGGRTSGTERTGILDYGWNINSRLMSDAE